MTTVNLDVIADGINILIQARIRDPKTGESNAMQISDRRGLDAQTLCRVDLYDAMRLMRRLDPKVQFSINYDHADAILAEMFTPGAVEQFKDSLQTSLDRVA